MWTDQAYESSVHVSPVALCSRYLLTSTHCLWSVGISFSYIFLQSQASIQWKREQVIASIISTVLLFTDSITRSKIFKCPPSQDLISKCSTLLYLGLFFISPIFHALNAFFCNIFGFLLVCFTGILRWVKRCIIYEPTFFLQHFRFVPTAILSSSVTIRFPWPFFFIVLIPQLYWCFCIGRTSKFRQCFILLVSDDVFCIFHEISLFFRCSDSIFNI